MASKARRAYRYCPECNSEQHVRRQNCSACNYDLSNLGKAKDTAAKDNWLAEEPPVSQSASTQEMDIEVVSCDSCSADCTKESYLMDGETDLCPPCFQRDGVKYTTSVRCVDGKAGAAAKTEVEAAPDPAAGAAIVEAADVKLTRPVRQRKPALASEFWYGRDQSDTGEDLQFFDRLKPCGRGTAGCPVRRPCQPRLAPPPPPPSPRPRSVSMAKTCICMQ
jgi:hypothetical protein